MPEPAPSAVVRTAFTVAAACFTLIACAKQAPPSGGPPDRLAPAVVSTSPSADSVNVGLHPLIQLRFNESMDRASVERALFFSPALPAPIEYRWKGAALTIKVGDSLRSDRTYVISVGAEAADLSRNRLRGTFTLAFATGPELNRGQVAGRILRAGGGRSQVYVWAFDVSPDPSGAADTSGALDPSARAPDYITQPGPDGGYQFARLSDGRYRIIAFEDADGDRTFTSTDPTGIAPSDAEVASSADSRAVTLGPIRIVKVDSTGPDPVSARTTDQTHLLIRFNEPIQVPESLDVEGLDVRALYRDPADSSRLWALTEPQEAGRDYRISLGNIVDTHGNAGNRDARLDVRGDGSPDTRAPQTASTDPVAGATDVSPRTDIHISFTEAVTPSLEAAALWSVTDSAAAPAGTLRWEAVNRLLFIPDVEWPQGAQVRLRAAFTGMTDAAGNHFDQDLELHFTVSRSDSLGNLIGSAVPISHPRIVRVTPTRGSAPYRSLQIAAGDSTFRFDGLPAGSYRIDGFADLNDNGTWDKGSLRPFLTAEPWALRADTLAVRPRWDVQMEHSLNVAPVATDPRDGRNADGGVEGESTDD